jgi:hypothetical protein
MMMMMMIIKFGCNIQAAQFEEHVMPRPVLQNVSAAEQTWKL